MDPWTYGPMGPATHARRRAQEPSGSSSAGMDGRRPRGKAKGKANRNKVVETKKHGKAIIRTRGGESSLHTT